MSVSLPREDHHVPPTTLEHVEGFFRAVEEIGGYTDHFLSFQLESVTRSHSTQQAVEEFFRAQCEGPSTLWVRLSPLAGGLLQVADRFMHLAFEFALDPESNRYKKIEESELLSLQQGLAQQFVWQLVALTRREPVNVFSIELGGHTRDSVAGKTFPWRDIQQEEFLLESTSSRYYLNLGWND